MSAKELKDFKSQLAMLSFTEQLSLMEFLAKLMNRTQKTQTQSASLPNKKRQFGSAKGKFVYPTDFDEDNEEIAQLFGAI